MFDRGRQRQPVGAGKAQSERQIAGGFFRHGDGQIDLVGCAGDFVGVDIDILEIAQSVDPLTRQLDALAVVPARFELAEFTPHHLVAGAGVARNVDAPDIDAALRLGRQHQRDLAIGAVDLGARIDARKCIAKSAETIGEGLGRGGDHRSAVRLASANANQLLELIFLAQVVSNQPDGGHGIGLPLLDRDRDGDVLLVGRNRDLCGLDVELEIAAIEVVSTQGVEVSVELGARVAVVLGVPGQPAAGGQIHQSGQGRLGEHLGTDDADLADARRIAFSHRETDVDAVAIGRGDGRHHLGAVEAARQILALDLLLGPVDQCPVERQAFPDARILERLDQGVFVKFLQTDETDCFDHWPLFDHHHCDAAVDLDAHVLEKAGREQGTQRSSGLVVGVVVANPKRQRGEDSAGIGTLQALDADILQHKGFDGKDWRRGECSKERDDSCRVEKTVCGEGGHQCGQCRPNRRAMSLKRATDIIISKTATPPRCNRASHRSETGRPVRPSKR